MRPNQVCGTDLTYIRLARDAAYLVGVIDWYSQRVLAWPISNSMDASFCVHCPEDASQHRGKLEVFKSDERLQFTGDTFIGVLTCEGMSIGLDGRGRALDSSVVERLWHNVKYEEVGLKGDANIANLIAGLTQYFAFHNAERPR